MTSHTILLAEDDLTVLTSIAIFLREHGFEVTSVTNGQQALDELSAKTFDLVLTDIVMDEVDGIDVLKSVKEQSPNTMVIILTGFGEINSAIDSLRLNADDYLVKPCEPQELLHRISACLQKLELKKEKHRAEVALKESEAKYKNLIEFTNDIIWSMDIHGDYNYANKAATRILGYETDEILNRSAIPDVHPDDRDLAQKIMEMSIKEQCGWDAVVLRWLHKDGSVRYMESTATPVFDSTGKLTGFNGIDRDVTDSKRAEEERFKTKKLESIKVLSGGLAHDFNNLLFIITGSLELIKDELASGSNEMNFISEIESASKQLTGLVKELESFARGVTTETIIDSPTDILKKFIEHARSSSDTKYSSYIAEDLWPIEFDATQIHQVIKNLILNAEYAVEDKGNIEISAKNCHADDACVTNGLIPKDEKFITISVKDDGTGIPKEILPQIFDPYFSTRQRGSQKGMGMGLATVQSIVKNHQGKIKVETNLGEGTTFHLYLPVNKNKTIPKVPEKHDPAISKTGNILVMDDEPMIRNVVCGFLEKLGHKAVVAGSGEETIETFKRAINSNAAFDAVILDLTVKNGIGGKQVIEELLEIDPDTRAIIASGYTNDPIITKFQDYGFKGALTKPYNHNELKEMLDKII